MLKKPFKLNIFLAALLISACAFLICRPLQARATSEAEVSSGKTTVEADIRDIADPMAQNIEKRSHALPLLLSAAGVLLLWALYLRLSKKAPEEKVAAPPEPEIPPHVIALEELEALSRSDLLSRREFKLWYMRLSWICRVYIGAALDFNCVDSDACEIMAKLRLKKVPDHLIIRFEEILSECDLVKFAKADPDENDARGIFEKCVETVKKSRDVNFK